MSRGNFIGLVFLVAAAGAVVGQGPPPSGAATGLPPVVINAPVQQEVAAPASGPGLPGPGDPAPPPTGESVRDMGRMAARADGEAIGRAREAEEVLDRYTPPSAWERWLTAILIASAGIGGLVLGLLFRRPRRGFRG